MGSAFLAIIQWNGKPVVDQVLEAANACMQFRCPDGSWIWVNGSVGLAQADLATLPEDEPGCAVTFGPLHIVADCRIDNRDDIIRALPSSYRSIGLSDAAIVLASYAVWGERCVDRLIGEFAFVIWDSYERRVFAARDLSGARRLFYYQDRDRLLLASDRTQILQDPTVPMEIDEDQLLDYFTPAYQWTSGWDQGLFQGFQVLSAGHMLCGEQGNVSVRRFWNWSEHEPIYRPEQQVLEEYLHVLQEAIRCRLRSRVRPIAFELSGGLDSTAIVALAARMNSGAELHTLSLVFERFADPAERQRIDAMVERYPVHSHMVVADTKYIPDYLLQDWHPRIIGGPQEFAGDVPMTEAYEAARQAGCRVVLTGLMGDSLNEGCERVYYDLLRRGRLGEVFQRLQLTSIWSRRNLGALFYYGLLPFAPWSILRPLLVWLELRQGFYCGELPFFFTPRLQEHIRERDRSLRVRQFNRLGVRSPAVRFTLEEMQTPMISGTMPCPQPLEFRHPYYDRRLVEFVLSMPQEQKWNHAGKTYKESERLHHRRALRGIVPDIVLDQKEGMDFSEAVQDGLAPQRIVSWLKNALTIHIFDRGYVVPDVFLRTLAAPGKDYSYVSSLLTVEAWLRAIAPGGAMLRLIPPRRSVDVFPLHFEHLLT